MRFMVSGIMVAAYVGSGATVVAFALAIYAAASRDPRFRTAAQEILNVALIAGVTIVVFAIGLLALTVYQVAKV